MEKTWKHMLAILVLLTTVDLQVNYSFTSFDAGQEGNLSVSSDLLHTWELNLALDQTPQIEEGHGENSSALCCISMIRILAVTAFFAAIYTNVIRPALSSAVRFSILGTGYISLCHLLYIILRDSENAGAFPQASYWALLVLNAGLVISYTALSYIAWHNWHSTLPVSNKKAQDDTEDESLDDDEDGERTTPVLTLLRKVSVYYSGEIRQILLCQVLLFISAMGASLCPYYEAMIMDVISAGKSRDEIYAPLMMYAICCISTKAVDSMREVVTNFIGGRVSKRVRSDLFCNVVGQDMAFFDNTKSGEISEQLTCGHDDVSEVYCEMQRIVKNIMYIVMLVRAAMFVSWKLTLIIVMCNCLLVIRSLWHMIVVKQFWKDMHKNQTLTSDIGQESVTCIKTIRTFATEKEQGNRYTKQIHKKFSLCQFINYFHHSLMSMDEMIVVSVRAVIMVYGSHLVVTGQLTSGQLISFLLSMGIIFGHTTHVLTWQLDSFVKKFAKLEKLFKYLDRKPEMKLDGTYAPKQIKGEIEFRDVTFEYPSRAGKPVLQGVSFTVKPGEVVALVGPSGSGKSTCIQLLERFYDPTGGEVLLDGTPLSEYQHDNIHKHIGLVSQEPVLFARSIKDNISYGADNLTDDNIEKAAKDANAHNFIMDLQNQYKTSAGEFGKHMSGGQKQRIAIARAVVRDPKILLLDEATSALDAESESLVQEALERNMKGRTVVVVAHRLSTVARADRIVVMQHGKVVEQGPPQELLANRGLYYELVQKQMMSCGSESKNQKENFS